VTDKGDTMTEHTGTTSPTARDALHATVDLPFEEAVDTVQVEHEIAGFETVKVTRLDEMVKGFLDEDVDRTALIVMCHAEIARDALAIDPSLAAMLPCTTAVYELEGEEGTEVHVRHVSVTKGMRDLGLTPADGDEAVGDLVAHTGELMEAVWERIEEL
jgi:uncharacterized protein (DUF302 family)